MIYIIVWFEMIIMFGFFYCNDCINITIITVFLMLRFFIFIVVAVVMMVVVVVVLKKDTDLLYEGLSILLIEHNTVCTIVEKIIFIIKFLLFIFLLCIGPKLLYSLTKTISITTKTFKIILMVIMIPHKVS